MKEGETLNQFENKSVKMRSEMASMAGGQDTSGMEVSHNIRVINRLIDLAASNTPEFGELSGPRLGILMRLLFEEKHGGSSGINPTSLSLLQSVKKNTITSLLNRLEESGLIERLPDPADRRGKLVRISPAGRELVLRTAPGRFEVMNQLTASLDAAERAQLLALLNKLRISLQKYRQQPPHQA